MDQSHCGASVGHARTIKLVYAHDAVFLAVSLDVQVMVCNPLREKNEDAGTSGLLGQAHDTGVRTFTGWNVRTSEHKNKGECKRPVGLH